MGSDWLLPFHSGLPSNFVNITTNTNTKRLLKCSYQWRIKRTRLGWDIHSATSLCLDFSLFVQINLSSVPSQSRSFCSRNNCSLGFPTAFFSFPSPSPIDSSIPRATLCFLSQFLFSAMSVVFMVVVLSLCLLVTEEVAPPASRVVHLFGRPSAPHLLHFLRKIEAQR